MKDFNHFGSWIHISVHSLSYRCNKGTLIRACVFPSPGSDKQQHSCHVLHDHQLNLYLLKLIQLLIKHVCLVLVETSTPPPASHAHALTRTRTHVFHSWIISVILLAVKRVQLNHWAWGGRGERARWITGVLTCYSGASQGGGSMEGVSQLTLSTKGERSKNSPQTLNPQCDFIQGELWMPSAASACFSDKPCDVRWHMRCSRPADRLNPAVRERALGPGHRPNVWGDGQQQ